MGQKDRSDKASKQVSDKEARLKAALKSNMARRKAQARARQASGDEDKNEQGQ